MLAPYSNATLEGKTVLHVLPALEEGGAQAYTLAIVKALRECGARGLVACAKGPKAQSLGTDHIPLPTNIKNPIGLWLNATRLSGLIGQRNVDLVHVHSRAPAWSVRSAARRTNVRLVTTCHGNYRAAGALKRAYNQIMVQGERVIAVSDFIAEQIEGQYACPSSRIRLIKPGIDTTEFDPACVSPQDKEAMRATWEIPKEARIVLLPARMTRLKGHALLIEAMRRLADQNLVAVFGGSYRGREAYRRELEKLATGMRVRFVGHIDDMPTAYATSSVVVSTSKKPESFGLVLAEAGAMGVPTVSNDHGGAREIVLHGKTGWLVRPNDPDALAKGIRNGLSGAGPQLTANARAHVLARFTRERMCIDTLAVYRELL